MLLRAYIKTLAELVLGILAGGLRNSSMTRTFWPALEQNTLSNSSCAHDVSCAAIAAVPENNPSLDDAFTAGASRWLASVGTLALSKSRWCGPSHLITCKHTLFAWNK